MFVWPPAGGDELDLGIDPTNLTPNINETSPRLNQNLIA